MPLNDKQRAALEAEAKRRGVDPSALIKEAEALVDGQLQSGQPVGTREKPKLFMYLLPFVTVREVRQKWLELTDSFPGDNENAAAWAAKQSPTGGAPVDDEADAA